ncbi:hypothetical protein NEOLEDRAFT_1143817 [Neolentinus lepideus HHB14362 ss-1]|uniref:Uncharacterized protein n=1 Tax=Neolentinus lepideus HHB14362 ss-1 TaxID=1314782 RepID=A0A165MB78_9AGAM|nr:hypothetical protein NEOLEDRAFT_1143817 [Neolentinus lepideus HHB14362 ss-1]
MAQRVDSATDFFRTGDYDTDGALTVGQSSALSADGKSRVLCSRSSLASPAKVKVVVSHTDDAGRVKQWQMLWKGLCRVWTSRYIVII